MPGSTGAHFPEKWLRLWKQNLVEKKSAMATVRRNGAARPKIWIDMDNTPHVPFFEPIMEELKARGFSLLVTARDAFQLCDLADKGFGIRESGPASRQESVDEDGRAGFSGAAAFVGCEARETDSGVSHGSRSQLLLSNWLGKPTILIEDYEHCQFPPMMRPTWIMAPDVIPNEVLPCKSENVRKYSGIKEDVYAWKLQPDPNF